MERNETTTARVHAETSHCFLSIPLLPTPPPPSTPQATHKAIAFNNPFRVSPITSQLNRFIRRVSFFPEFVYWLRHCRPRVSRRHPRACRSAALLERNQGPCPDGNYSAGWTVPTRRFHDKSIRCRRGKNWGNSPWHIEAGRDRHSRVLLR